MNDSRSISNRSLLFNEFKAFLTLALPLAGVQLSQAAIGFVDTLMMGRIGLETLAAGGLAALTFSVFVYTTSGILMGVSPIVATAYGAGDKPQIERVVQQGCLLVIGLAVPISFGIANFDILMRNLGQAETTVVLGNTYLDIMVWGFFPALGFALLRSVVSAMSHTRIVMSIAIGGTIINIIGDYVLGFGKFGFPKLGIAGLAVASIFTLWVMFLSLLGYILTHKELKTYRFFRQIYRVDRQIIASLIRVGVPIGIATALEIGLFTIVTYLMGLLGTEVLAAHQVVLQTVAITFMVPLAMSYAATIRVGQEIGQNNRVGAIRAGYVGVAIGLGFMLLMAAILLLFPDRIIGIFLDLQDPRNANVVPLATGIMTIAAISQILDGPQKIIMGALYGLQDTRIPAILSFVAFWGIGLTIGYWLGFHTSLGGSGLWLGQSIGIAISAVMFFWRFHHLVSRKHQ
ncbi:MATE family efflux transporter [Chamaesiphon minutus]|uniref:Probable multidrug resistance protein NorM n=1 Tax=Chamaesiphon minutus (strain ATCC 27169 / PCC 6605) TaxID=1173020 RepID=K9UJ66_CHAP6|nr:putative efflux protein, MATE family [Chamaesiphon minutus PCC 6605]